MFIVAWLSTLPATYNAQSPGLLLKVAVPLFVNVSSAGLLEYCGRKMKFPTVRVSGELSVPLLTKHMSSVLLPLALIPERKVSQLDSSETEYPAAFTNVG